MFSRIVSLSGERHVVRQRIVRGDILNRRDDGFALGPVVPGLVPQRQQRVDVVLHACGVAVLTGRCRSRSRHCRSSCSTPRAPAREPWSASTAPPRPHRECRSRAGCPGASPEPRTSRAFACPRPSASDGANARRSCVTKSRPGMPPSCQSPFSRNADRLSHCPGAPSGSVRLTSNGEPLLVGAAVGEEGGRAGSLSEGSWSAC